MAKDGTPYAPRDEAELDTFETGWCKRCASEDIDNGEYCPISCGFYGGENPAEWVFKDGHPSCTEFESFEGMQPIASPRCQNTLELFE